MKILFYDTKPYDKDSFEEVLQSFPGITIEYTKSDLMPGLPPLPTASMLSVPS